MQKCHGIWQFERKLSTKLRALPKQPPQVLKFTHHNYHNNNFHGASAHFRDMVTPITEPNSKTLKNVYKGECLSCIHSDIVGMGDKSAFWTSTICNSGQLRTPVKRCRFKACLISWTAETSISGEGKTFMSDLQSLFALRRKSLDSHSRFESIQGKAMPEMSQGLGIMSFVQEVFCS